MWQSKLVVTAAIVFCLSDYSACGQPCQPEIIGSIGGYARDVEVVGTIAYLANALGGLVIVDVSDPANPTILGAIDTPGTALGVAVSGSAAYVADYSSGLQVIDVSSCGDCPGDLDGSGDVGTPDFLALLAAWGPNEGDPADLDGDGTVGTTDFLELLANWGACP